MQLLLWVTPCKGDASCNQLPEGLAGCEARQGRTQGAGAEDKEQGAQHIHALIVAALVNEGSDHIWAGKPSNGTCTLRLASETAHMGDCLGVGVGGGERVHRAAGSPSLKGCVQVHVWAALGSKAVS